MTMAMDKRVDAPGQLVLNKGWADAETIDEYRHRCDRPEPTVGPKKNWFAWSGVFHGHIRKAG